MTTVLAAAAGEAGTPGWSSILWGLVIAVILILLTGWFVAAEFGILASRKGRVEAAADSGANAGPVALGLIGDIGTSIAGIQLGITIFSVVLGYIAEPAVLALLERVFEPWVDLTSGPNHTVAFIVAYAMVSFLHILIGEMVPKNLAIARPERTLLVLAFPTRAFIWLFKPVIWTLNAIGNLGARLFGVDPAAAADVGHGTGELAVIVRQSAEEGFLDPGDHELVSGALDFNERTVAEIMTPRDLVVSMPRWSTVAQLEGLMARTGHSRIPITGAGGLDAAIGFIHAKSLLSLDPSESNDSLPAKIVADLLVFAPDRPIDQVLRAMKVSRRHIGLVETSEGGEVVGLVTLEDVLEELVGEIRDESDRVRRRARWRAAGTTAAVVATSEG